MKWYHYAIIDTQEAHDMEPYDEVRYCNRLLDYLYKIGKLWLTQQ